MRTAAIVHTFRLWLSQGWNKKWDEWVEAEGLTKYKKELAKVEFTKEGEGGTREFGGKAEAAEGNGRSRAEGGRKTDKGHKQGALVTSKVSTFRTLLQRYVIVV